LAVEEIEKGGGDKKKKKTYHVICASPQPERSEVRGGGGGSGVFSRGIKNGRPWGERGVGRATGIEGPNKGELRRMS